MPKQDKKDTDKRVRVTAYLEPDLFDRYTTAKDKRAKLIKPAHMSDSEYAVHLIEYGLKMEEKELEEAQAKENKPQKPTKQE